MTASLHDELLVEHIRRADGDAWAQLIARYEGRLLAFVDSRLRDRSASEDIVQESFIGFLTSLPHYDGRRDLESYLFAIAAHKLSDFLRRQGRRPAIPLAGAILGQEPDEIAGPARHPSSIARSAEHRRLEERALAGALKELIAGWKARGDWERLRCMELLWVRGWPNKTVAERLGISEQAVANHKFQVIAKLRKAVEAAGGGRTPAPLAPRGHSPLPAPIAEEQSPAAQPESAGSDEGPSDADLLAYLEEALPAGDMARIEQALRGSDRLRRRLAECVERTQSGAHTVGDVWRRGRISCPTRSQLGSYLLEALERELAEYVAFHVQVVGCRACLANADDLRQQQHGSSPQTEHRQQRFFQSSAGYLHRRSR